MTSVMDETEVLAYTYTLPKVGRPVRVLWREAGPEAWAGVLTYEDHRVFLEAEITGVPPGRRLWVGVQSIRMGDSRSRLETYSVPHGPDELHQAADKALEHIVSIPIRLKCLEEIRYTQSGRD